MIGIKGKTILFTQGDLDREHKARLDLYLQCIEIRNFEISNLVARNNFFMIFQGVLIAGLCSLVTKGLLWCCSAFAYVALWFPCSRQ